MTGRWTLVVGIAVLATSSCSHDPLGHGSRGTGGAGSAGGDNEGSAAMDGGNSGAGGGDVTGDGGTTQTSGLPVCPEAFKEGGPCPIEGGACLPQPRCQACIGGYYKVVPPSSSLPCLCRAGILTCIRSPLGPGPDCVVEDPPTCDAYVDPACTVHPPCVP